MLDTFMALWNQKHQENRRRAGKILLTFLCISISISLLLFTLHLPSWSLLLRQKQASKNVEALTNQQVMLSSGDIGTAAMSVAPTPVSTLAAVPSCIVTPSPTASRTPVPSPGRMLYPESNGNDVYVHSQEHAPSKSLPRKKGNSVLKVPPTRKIPAVPVVKPTHIVTVTAVTPVITATVSVEPTQAVSPLAPSETSIPATALPNDSIVTNAQSLADDSAHSSRHRGGAQIIEPMAMGRPARCAGNAIGIIVSDDVIAAVERRMSLILASALLGTALFYVAAYIIKRKTQSMLATVGS